MNPVAKKQSIPSKLQIWLEARRRYHLTDRQIQMAQELGFNPKKFGGYANSGQESWKRPLGEFIEHLYLKRFKRSEPERLLSLEEQAAEMHRKQAKKKARKSLRQPTAVEPPPEAGTPSDWQR